MEKEKQMYYAVTFPLQVDKRAEHILNKRFAIACKLYNELMALEKARFIEYKNTKAYRKAVSLTRKKAEISAKGSLNKEDKMQIKEMQAEIKNIYQTLQKGYGLSEFAFIKEMTRLYKIYNKNIDSSTASAIAKRVWTSFAACLYKSGKEPHFKKSKEYNSITSLRNNTGIRVKDKTLIWGKNLQIPIKIDENKAYEKYSYVESNIVYPIIKRKCGKFYVQILFKGIPFVKGRSSGTGTVGIQMGSKHIYIASKESLVIKDLPPLEQYKSKINNINRKLDASRRTMNPNKYNTDGTAKRGNKDKWVFSKEYIRLLKKKQELEKKQAEYRKQQCNIIANEIIAMGNSFKIIKPNFEGMKLKKHTIQRVAENAEERKLQITESRKRKDIQDYAPSEFINILKVKADYFNCEVIEVDPSTSNIIKTINHIDGTILDDSLNAKTDYINGICVERKLYNAFLLRHYDLKNKCLDEETENNFKELF